MATAIWPEQPLPPGDEPEDQAHGGGDDRPDEDAADGGDGISDAV
ncbi:hypothetical protein [Methanoculleus frigidifontis]|nr:hypothetical protein [Methanoculleus sp. FWC-SCC1]